MIKTASAESAIRSRKARIASRTRPIDRQCVQGRTPTAAPSPKRRRSTASAASASPIGANGQEDDGLRRDRNGAAMSPRSPRRASPPIRRRAVRGRCPNCSRHDSAHTPRGRGRIRDVLSLRPPSPLRRGSCSHLADDHPFEVGQAHRRRPGHGTRPISATSPCAKMTRSVSTWSPVVPVPKRPRTLGVDRDHPADRARLRAPRGRDRSAFPAAHARVQDVEHHTRLNGEARSCRCVDDPTKVAAEVEDEATLATPATSVPAARAMNRDLVLGGVPGPP